MINVTNNINCLLINKSMLSVSLEGVDLGLVSLLPDNFSDSCLSYIWQIKVASTSDTHNILVKLKYVVLWYISWH